MANDVKPKYQREISKFKANIRKLEKEKDKLFPGLGKAAYQAFLDGRLQEASLADLLERLKVLDAQIEQGHAEISRLTAQVERMKAAAAQPPAAACPHCGAIVSQGTKFCGNCGRDLAPPASAAVGACDNCGSPLVPGAPFCAQCGKTVVAAQAPPSTIAAPPATPPPPPPAAAAPPPAVAATPTADTGGGPRKCASCGAIAEEADAGFCGGCGARLS